MSTPFYESITAGLQGQYERAWDSHGMLVLDLAPSTRHQLEDNLVLHHQRIAEARERRADLVVFPELGLTGYLLQDLASEVLYVRHRQFWIPPGFAHGFQFLIWFLF